MKGKKQKHIPMRRCIGCNTSKAQSELVRIVFNVKTGDIKLDKDRKLSGRGTYLCNNNECVELAIKRKSFERVFKTGISQNIKDNIAEEIKNEAGKNI